MIERYGHWVIRWRYLIIIATILLSVLAASGGRFLVFTTDYRVFFSDANPQLLAFEELQNTYTKNDNVMFVLAPKDGQVFTPEMLSAVEWVTEQAWKLPHSIRVDSISNFQHTYGQDDDLIVENLVVEGENLSAEDIERIKQVALNEPVLRDRLISERTHVTAINVTIQLPGVQPQEEVREVVDVTDTEGHLSARDLVAQIRERYPQIDVHLTGIVVMNLAFEEASKDDLMTLVPAMYLVVILSLAIMLRAFAGFFMTLRQAGPLRAVGQTLRGLTGTFSTLLLLTFSIFGAMGLAGWLGIELTGPSASAPIIILTLAVADSVHFLTSMLYEMRANNRSKHEAIVEALRLNFMPIFLTSLTTIIGFLSMNFGEVPPFADMGNIVSMGVALAFVWSVTFLPAMMALLPVKVRTGQETIGVRLMDRFADFVVHKRQALLWGMGVLIIASVALIPRNQLNDIFVHYFDETFAFRQATDFLTENLTGLYDVHYSMASGEAEGISKPEFLGKVEAFANWYRQQPGVIHVNVITDTFKRLNKNLHAEDDSFYRVPEERELAAQYLLLYEMSLPYGLDLNNQINVDKSNTKVSITMETMSTNDVLALEASAQQWLQQNGLPSMQVAGSSTTVMFANIGSRNIRAMLLAAFVALILISVILAFALRSVKFGLISLVPNLAPAGVAFGLWGIFVGEIGLALSVIAGVTLGIVVDDTIHFMSKYLRARREQGMDATAAVRYAFHSVGMALFVTTVVLVAGFMVLAQSHFKINAEMGLMTAATITIALIVDFLFLPPLLIKLDQDTDKQAVAVKLEEQPA